MSAPVVSSSSSLRKLAPKDFAFLWDECRRCFYLKVVHGLEPPRSTFPQIFSKIASQQERYFSGKRTQELVPELAPGVFDFGERWVTSRPITLEGRTTSVYISGRADKVISFDDESYGVIDFKTSELKSPGLSRYSRQLHAYGYALENPREGSLHLKPVTQLGVLCLDVSQFGQGKERKEIFYLRCKPTWIPFARDDAGFLDFVGQVVDVLDRPTPPAASERCSSCRHREASRRLGTKLGCDL